MGQVEKRRSYGLFSLVHFNSSLGSPPARSSASYQAVENRGSTDLPVLVASRAVRTLLPDTTGRKTNREHGKEDYGCRPIVVDEVPLHDCESDRHKQTRIEAPV